MKFLILTCVLLGSTMLVGFKTAVPKCAVPTFKAEYEFSAAVFVGEVVKEVEHDGKKYFVFKVKRYWKGVRSEYIKVRVNEIPRYQSPFEKGKTFLVFAKKSEDGDLWDGRCSHSAEMGGTRSSLSDDLEMLGEGKTCIDLEEVEGENVD